METIIKVQDVEKIYNDNTVLKNINLTVEKGEVVALLGKNGAGKSTLFKLIAGLADCTQGHIEVLGSNPKSINAKSRLGITINEPVFYQHLSATDNLRIHCEYYGLHDINLAEMLEYVGLTANDLKPVKQYSLGMRQRLALARCLIHNPDVLIIDEPLNGLDPKGIRDFRKLVEDLTVKGTTIILSSHILTEVQTVATRIAVIYDGIIIADKAKEEWHELYGDDFEDTMISMMEGLCK